MKPKLNNPLFSRSIRSSLVASAIVCTLSGFASQAGAQTLYWDTNGITPGLGTGGGTWDSGTNWSTSLDGDVATTAWADGNIARFQNVGDYSITLAGTVATPQIRFAATGAQSVTGGTINISPSTGITLHSAAAGNTTGNGKTIASAITGVGPLTLTVNGDLSATGGGSATHFTLSSTTSDFTGDLTITSGLLNWTNDAALGNAANKIILNGGGIIDPNLSRTTNRNLQIDAGGGTIRTYGSATSTLAGVISGAGSINRTDGGFLVVTNPANTHSGTWNLQGGTLRLGGGGSLGNATVNNGTTLDFRNDATAAAYNNAISGAGSITVNSTAGTTYTGTVTGTGFLAVGTAVNNSILTLDSGANVTVNNASLGEATGIAGTTTQKAGTTVVVNNDFRVGHWSNQTSVYNMEGGSLSINGTPAVGNTNFETPGVLILGVDGIGIFNQTGGTVTAAGLGLDTRSDTAGTDQYNLNGGTLRIGSKGIGGFSSSELNFGGGTLQPTADFPSASLWRVNSGSTLDLNDSFVTHSGSILGSSSLTLIDTSIDLTGMLRLNGANQTISANLTGSVPIQYTGTGTLNLTGTMGHSGPFALQGGTLNLTGSTASALTLNGATSLRGEGSVTGGLTALGTLNLAFNPTTEPGALSVTGGLTVNDVVTLSFSNPLPPTLDPLTVITYDSISGPGSFVLPNSSSYRSPVITVGANAVTLDLNTKTQTWTSGTVWDTGTTGVWNDGAVSTDTFFWGDTVVFNDTATSTAVTLTGNLQPSSITVNSNTNNFTLTGNAGNLISGTTSLLKSGSSTLTISGPNTYTGGTIISQGTIVVTGVNNGLGTGAVTLGDANTGSANVALLLTNGRGLGNAINVTNNGTGTATLGFSGTGASYTEFTGPVTLARNLTILAGTTDRLHFGGAISGTGNITVTGGQRVTMSGNNSFVGNVSISGTNTVFQTFGGNPVPDASNVDIGTGSTFQIFTSETIAGLSGAGRLWPVAGKPTLTVGTNNVSSTFTGSWVNNGSDHVNLTKVGTGTQTLSGTITSPGALTINGGTVALTGTASFDRTFAPGTALPNRALQGSGTLRAETGSSVTLRRSGVGFTGAVQVATGGTVTIGQIDAAGSTAGSVALQGGTLAFDNSGSFFTPISGTVMTGGTLSTDITTTNYGTMHNTGGDVVPGTTTHAYSGKIYLTAGQWSFAKRFDDAGSVTIAGTTILNDTVWNNTATGSFTANSSGWYDIDVRVQQGGGGVGPSGGWTKGIGIKQGAATTAEADYAAFGSAAMAALGARTALTNDFSFTRPISVSGTSTIDTTAMLGTPGTTGTDGNGGNGDVTLTSGLTGTGELRKAGTGTLTLGASNSFSGALTVNGGALRINASVGAASGFTVNPGAVLETNATNIFVGGHGTAMADSRVIAVNGGTWIITGSHDARFGNVSLSNGATWTSNRGLSNYDALLANTTTGAASVTVANSGGNTSPSVMNGTGGIHLQDIQNFNVADVTASSATDLQVNMILAAQGTIGGAAGGVRKLGTGTMALAAANTYNGGTTVEAGTVLVNNTTGSGTGTGNVLVKTGATLGGTGSISGALTLENGATLAPGITIESLATGTLTLAASSTVQIQIDSSGTPSADVINVTGTATLAGSLSLTDIAGSPAVLPGGTKLTLLTYTTGVSGQFTGLPEGSILTLGPNSYKLSYADANAVTLEVQVAGYDSWKTQIADVNQRARTDDPDGDGFSNLQEFLFGTDPSANTGSLVSMTSTGSGLVLKWLERENGSNYSLLESSTLGTGSWTPSTVIPALDDQTGVPTDYDRWTATIPLGSGSEFFRVQGVEE